jgi:hypothetical protein
MREHLQKTTCDPDNMRRIGVINFCNPPIHILKVLARVAGSHHFNEVPDPAFSFPADPDPVFTLMLIGIHFEPLKLMNFGLSADPDPDPVFLSNADLDLASEKIVSKLSKI